MADDSLQWPEDEDQQTDNQAPSAQDLEQRFTKPATSDDQRTTQHDSAADLEKQFGLPPHEGSDRNPNRKPLAPPQTEPDDGGLHNKLPVGPSALKNLGLKIVVNKKAKGGGIAGIILAVIMFVSGALFQGPLQIVHYAQLLSAFNFDFNTSIIEDRMDDAYRYLRYPDNPELRRIGRLQRGFAARAETRMRAAGLEPNYSNAAGSKGRLVSLDITDPDIVREGIAAGVYYCLHKPINAKLLSRLQHFRSGQQIQIGLG